MSPPDNHYRWIKFSFRILAHVAIVYSSGYSLSCWNIMVKINVNDQYHFFLNDVQTDYNELTEQNGYSTCRILSKCCFPISHNVKPPLDCISACDAHVTSYDGTLWVHTICSIAMHPRQNFNMKNVYSMDHMTDINGRFMTAQWWTSRLIHMKYESVYNPPILEIFRQILAIFFTLRNLISIET